METSFDEIYLEYHQYIYHYVLGLCRDTALAEDITQDAFLKVLNKLDTFKGECKLNVWICEIAKNTYFNYCRKKRITPLDEVEQTASEDNVELNAENKDATLRIHSALHKLEEPYREVFWMRTFGELPFSEIGSIHGKTESWARVTFYRARLKIMEAMK